MVLISDVVNKVLLRQMLWLDLTSESDLFPTGSLCSSKYSKGDFSSLCTIHIGYFNGIYKYCVVLKGRRPKITMTNEYYLKTAFR